MGETFQQVRPDWCPHADCDYIASSQNKICKGVLPCPAPHGDGFNTHRFCLDTRESGHGVFDLQINNTDIFNIKRILSAAQKRVTPENAKKLIGAVTLIEEISDNTEVKNILDKEYECYLLVGQKVEFGETELHLNAYTLSIMSFLSDAYELYPTLKEIIRCTLDGEDKSNTDREEAIIAFTILWCIQRPEDSISPDKLLAEYNEYEKEHEAALREAVSKLTKN